MKTRIVILVALLSLSLAVMGQSRKVKDGHKANDVQVFGQNLVTLPSSSALYQVQIMVRAGSADDPQGKEGTANLAAKALIEGGFGNTSDPTTKEKLAEITRPWGDAALPQVRVDKQATVFSMSVPRDAFPQFIKQVLQPMFTEPLWTQSEIDRLRREALTGIQSNLRFEDEESLGLAALDNWVIPGMGLDHLTLGTVKGLGAITPEDLSAFYKKFYQRENMFIATSINDPQELATLMNSLPKGESMYARAEKLVRVTPEAGRHLLIITQPNAIATGLHLGFPIPVTRTSDDYWPLFVGTTYFGLHRDSFGRLYKDIREDRGYNYGDYAYTEFMAGRPFFLFPPPGTPRTQQYFSMWMRPVGHPYTHFILKAMTAELDRFVKEGLTPQQVAEAKIRARTLYLNYAESLDRQLGYRLDDMFYGMKDNGYISTMLAKIDAVTPEQVNASIKKYLQVENLKYIVVTNESEGSKLADDVANGTNVVTKTLAEYHISEPVPDEKKKMLAQDEEWKAYSLNISRSNIEVVKAADMFESAPTGAK